MNRSWRAAAALGTRRALAHARRFLRWIVCGPGTRLRLWPRRVGSMLARLSVAWVLVSVLSVAALRFVPPVTTAFVLRERVFGEQPVARRWTPRSEISRYSALAVIAAEDQRFVEHHGFDLVQIRVALSDGSGRGASTISQQVAKNLFLWPGGGWFRKGIEAWFTVLIEALWPKRRILEVYLSIAEFGPGVFGVGEAAQRYFGKAPSGLTALEAARMAAVLPSPKRMSIENPSDYVRRRTAEIRRQMDRLGGTAYLAELW